VLDGPITGMSGTLRSTAYTVDAPPQTVACPGTLPAHITAILGLPLRGNTGVSLPVVATIYQP
jgi:hypothetical protein